MAAEGELCTACWAGTLALHEGMLVCEVCGNIIQSFAEEAQEYQAGISDARFFKKSEGMRAKRADRAAAAEPPPPPPVAEALRAYVQAVQQLLQHQARALVERFGMDPALSAAARELWLAFLARSRLLEPATTLKLEALAEAGATAGAQGSSDSEGEAPNAQMTHSRLSLRIQNELAPALHLRHTLSLLLLACWVLHEAASPLDVVRWALDGLLPYLAFPAVEGAPLQQHRRTLGGALITPRGVPPPASLHKQAAQLAAELGLACPPLGPALWLERYLAELALPQELLPLALQLLELHRPAPLLPAAVGRLDRHPWAQLMAVLVVAVKLCYGLDGGAARLPGLPPAPDWQGWAAGHQQRLSSVSAFPLSLEEAVQLDPCSFWSYLRYLQTALLADCAPPPELETVHQLFRGMALVEGGDGGGEAGCQVQQGSGLAGDGDVRQQQQGQHKHGLQEEEEEGEQLPYQFYGTAWQRGLFPPDYVLMLTACAALVWLVPEGLHELVVRLEQAMIGAECEVSFLYNSEEQARLARVREEGAWLKLREAEARSVRRRQQQLLEAGEG